MTVVVHSFAADSSLLDCCDLVGFCLFVCIWCFFHLMLAGRQPFGVLRWFQLFCFFHLVLAVAWLIREASFCLPPAFVVCSFFLCHRHLWSVLSFFATGICVRSLSFTAFSAIGIRVRLFVFALLALVSGYPCISQILVSCCVLAACQLHPWKFKLDFFASRLPCGQPYKFHFEANPIWYSTIKFTKSHSAKCSLHKWAWLRHSIKVSSFELYKFDPFSPHSRLIPRELMYSYALGCLWVVTVCCNTVGRHGRAFCRPHAYTFNEQSKMATALTPQTDVTSKSHVTDGEPDLQKIKWLKPT